MCWRMVSWKKRQLEERGLPDNTHQEVLIDEIVRLTGNGTSGQYPKSIRRIAVYNAEHHFTMVRSPTT